jgi:hypothetical protein
MWEPQPLTTLRASKACRGENFTFTLYLGYLRTWRWYMCLSMSLFLWKLWEYRSCNCIYVASMAVLHTWSITTQDYSSLFYLILLYPITLYSLLFVSFFVLLFSVLLYSILFSSIIFSFLLRFKNCCNGSLLYSCCAHLEHRASVKRFVSLQFLNFKTVGRTSWTGD